MSKEILFSYKGEDYILEFTRKTVERMERLGFVASDISDKPMSVLPALFAGAFIANHPKTSRKIIDEIYAKMPNKTDLLTKLLELYNAPLEALMEEPEDDEGNVEWEASW